MIVSSLADAARYDALGAGIAAGLAYLRTFDASVPDGRYSIDGDRVFAIVERYETVPGAEKRYESHRRHVDIQFVAAGRERILLAPSRALDVETEYDTEHDLTFYHDPPAGSSVLLRAGDIAILFPEDAHKPGCMAGGRDPVRKVVVKVRI